jgi:Arc/MetJ family transcription regulator
VTKTLIDVDPVLLSRAQELLGARTKKAAVNAALAEVVALHARRDFLAAAVEGAFADAADDELRDAAWGR